MAQSVDTEDDAGPPPSDGLTLVGETKRFLQRWQRVMFQTEAWDAELVAALRQQSRDLEVRAKVADMRGLAHHLQSCEHCFWNGEVDFAKLAHCLGNVSEVAWQWRHDLRRRSDLLSVERQGEVAHEQLTSDPSTMLAPPSIELFESSPPPPQSEVATAGEWLEQSLGVWSRPSLPGWVRRALRGGRGSAGEPTGSAPDRADETPGSAPSVAEPLAAADATLGTSGSEPESAPYAAQRATASAVVTERAAMGEWARPQRATPWWSAAAGLLGIVGIGGAIWVLGGAREQLVTSAPGAARGAAQATARAGDVAAPRLPQAAIGQLLAAAHGRGGLESPELASWLEEEAAELARTGGACTPGAVGCPILSTARGLSAAEAPRPGARASWLTGLELPGIGIDDIPATRQLFEFHTQGAVGREAFQELLFRCAAQRELILAGLERYDLPLDLLALPMAASGCVPEAESMDGLRGLWQLSPAAAKAYHLRVKAQVFDERLDLVKSTEAAVRMTEDLYRKLGSWELALAAYRLGPLALLARLRDAGDEDADYEALVKLGLLSDDAVRFVRQIQAFALILANLERFRFEALPARAAGGSAALEVPPGTRLGLVARAAASSTTKIRALNPALLGDRVPDWPGEKFVLRIPKEAELRARELLPELIASADHTDECVPHAFDWGRQRFTLAMASHCEQAALTNR